MTIVVSSHLLGELEKIATSYGIIRSGRMVQQITAAELEARCRDYITLQTQDPHRAAAVLEEKLGLSGYEVLPEGVLHLYDPVESSAVVAVLSENGVPVGSIGTHRQELEDYFVKLMGVGEHV